jgi:hypothetical protein
MEFKRVIVETPYKSRTKKGLRQNLRFARDCARDCLVVYCEAPFLSHLLYTQPGILDDNDPLERQDGIDAGLAWGAAAEATVVYLDRGISAGMYYGVQNARKAGRPIIFRTLSHSVPTSSGKLHTTRKVQIGPNPEDIENACRQLFKELPPGARAIEFTSDLDHLGDVYGPCFEFDGLYLPVMIRGTLPDEIPQTVNLRYEI